MIKTVQYRTHVLQQRMVVWLERACSGNDRREAGRFRHGYTADVQVMDQRAQAGQCRIVLESEGCNQDFESHFRVDVRKRCTVEVKADRSFRTIFRRFQPDELGFRIDEPTAQPRRTDAIDPQTLSGCPNARTVVFSIEAPDLAFSRMWLLGRELSGQSRLRIDNRGFDLRIGLSREKIHGGKSRYLPSRGGQSSTCLALIELREFSPQRLQHRSDRLIVRRAVKECSECVALTATGLASEFEDIGSSAAALNLLLLPLEHLSRGPRHRQDAHPCGHSA